MKDLGILIQFLDAYKLITQKYADYELFKKVFLVTKNKEHLTAEGLLNIVAIKASMNLGLSPELQLSFPNIKPENRPNVLETKIYPD